MHKKDKIRDKRYEIRGARKAFTLIEVLVVIGIIAILAAVVLVAVNPARQFKLARDSQRVSNVNALLNAIGQNMSEHRGVFVCATMASSGLPYAPTVVEKDPSNPSAGLDLAPCLVPDYLAALPFDPLIGSYISTSSYNTGYEVFIDQNGRVTASSSGELTPTISVTR